MPLPQLNRILIIRTDRIGDVVLTTPVFKAMRKAYPAAHITVLLTPATADLVKGNPYIDEVIIDDRRGLHKGLIGSLKLARLIRQGNFDAVFNFHPKRRYNLAVYAAGVPLRIGFKNDKFSFLLTHAIKDERHFGLKHEAQYCLDLLKVVGIESGSPDVFVATQKDAEDWAMRYFAEHQLVPGEVIAIHAGSSDTTRLWPKESFAQLMDALDQRYALKMILLGGPETAGLSKDIINRVKAPVLDLTGKTSMAQTASVLRRCRLLISNDSGPLHVGAGVGIHVISLFLRNQPGINPTRWRPLGNKAFMLTNKAGEEIILDSKGKMKSGKLDSIKVDEVLECVEAIFAKNSQAMFYW